jgi:hypothetical protein
MTKNRFQNGRNSRFPRKCVVDSIWFPQFRVPQGVIRPKIGEKWMETIGHFWEICTRFRVKNGQKWSKMTKNGQKWLKMTKNCVQNGRNSGFPWKCMVDSIWFPQFRVPQGVIRPKIGENQMGFSGGFWEICTRFRVKITRFRDVKMVDFCSFWVDFWSILGRFHPQWGYRRPGH